jgi:hypothetical protein
MDPGVTIQWLGDISLNGPFCDPQQALALRDNMQSIAARLGPCDLRIANWESPLWGDGRMNELKVPRLATCREAARATEPLALDVALLGNNHVYDCLEAGFDNTVAVLTEMGVETLGAGRSEDEAARPLIVKRGTMRLGLLNYVGSETHPNLPAGAGVFLNWFDEERAVSEIAALARETDAVLVHLHWGADEFIRMPAVSQRRTARRLVDAGARIVVGGHAHVLQGHEAWKGGHVFHGIGNFIFCPPPGSLQWPRQWPRYVREIGVASCRVTDGAVVDASVHPLVQEELELRWDDTPRRRRLERRLCRVLRLPDPAFARMRSLEAFMARQMRFRLHSIRSAGGFGPWLVAKCKRRSGPGAHRC